MPSDVVTHPILGRFTRDLEGGFSRHVRVGRRRVRLCLDCSYEGPENEAKHLEACLKIACRVHDRLDALLTEAAKLGSRRCLASVNRILVAEGKSPLTVSELIDHLSILDVCIAPDDGVVTFVVGCMENEHNYIKVRFGPRGGLREAYPE